MEVKSYFFDTYALYEIVEGNANYKKYSKNVAVITTRLNLMELHYGLMLDYGKKIADRYYDSFTKLVIDIDDDTIKQANEFRFKHRKRDLSYVDCIGYIMAKNRKIRFLTGDMQFEGLDNVEFVK